MGPITQTVVRDTAVDFSYPYLLTKIGFITKKPSPLPKVMAIVWPYDTKLWIALLVTLPAICMIYYSYSKLDKRGFEKSFNFGKAVLEAIQILGCQGMIHHYHLNKMKKVQRNPLNGATVLSAKN